MYNTSNTPVNLGTFKSNEHALEIEQTLVG